jgi:hypothetical protein
MWARPLEAYLPLRANCMEQVGEKTTVSTGSLGLVSHGP